MGYLWLYEMKKMKRFLWGLGVVLLLTLFLSACERTQTNTDTSELDTSDVNANEEVINKIESLELSYATQYTVDYYEKGYAHIHIADGTDYVLVPENEKENTLGLTSPVYIQMPCDNIYLAASSAMDLFLQLEELDSICACSTKAEDYAMEEVRKAINAGDITYVGKYSAPDYELLLSENCNLAIESTMISHSPKIKEQLEHIHIPVLVERSSYEEDPLGRLEWIKLYGVLTGREEESKAFFEQEVADIQKTMEANQHEQENTSALAEDGMNQKTVVFFSINSQGSVTVRKPGDYICKMIEMAGGSYALSNLLVEEENALSTVNIGMEDFYREAKDADILIYNGSIDGGVDSLDALIDKNTLLSDFKAVKEGNVWSTSLNMFQETSKVAKVIVELSDLLHGKEGAGVYLKHLE